MLDTEGIKNPDAIDNKFDNRIIYFILSVSHVVLFCNNGSVIDH